MFCEKCGTKLSIGSKFCMNCGAKVGAEEIVQGASALETAVQETAMQGTAMQETAVSAETPVIEAEPAATGKFASEIPDLQPAAAQYEIPVKEPVRESKAQAVPEQPVESGPAQAQQATPQQPARPGQPIPQTIPVQQRAPQQTTPQPVPVQAQSGASVEVPQNKPVQSAPVHNFNNPMSQSKNPAAQNIQNPAAPQNVRQPEVPFQSAEADMRPDKVKPLQTWKFAGMLIITGIPLINLIMVLVWSFSGGFNKNTRSFARAVLILWIAGLVLLIITAIVNWAMIQYIWSTLSSVQSGLPPIY